jgi:hypothetical protein
MPEDHLLVIGGLMAAVAPLIESQETALVAGLDELEAYDDIAAAGPLDRLMTSELMWLKLMRGEFARRVAEGEALRRRPVYRDPADDRAVVVLLDNGPEMLGRRRLVALAALLTLAASTLRRGDRFLWAATSHVGAPWQEGLTRRTLSRYVNQTGAEGLDAQSLERLLHDAPVDTGGDRAIVWTITPRHADFGDWQPQHRFEVEEQWPEAAPAGDGAAVAWHAEVTVTSGAGVRRAARFRFPDEQICADTLRAPFRAPSAIAHRDGVSNWAPDWFSQEADGGAVVLRDDSGIVFYRRYFAPLRFAFDAGDTLLGARWPGNGPCAIVLRQGDEIHAIRFGSDGHIFERASTSLAADHPLMAGAHAASAVPPLLRFGRKAAIAVGAPNGELYAVTPLHDALHSTLSVELVDQTKDLRLLARARSWLLCETERGGQRAFVLVNARTGKRMFLRRDPALDKFERIAACEVIGETGGALVDVDGAWRWIVPAWWPETADDLHPPVPAGAFVLRVDPLQHARNAVLAAHAEAHPMPERRWSALFWSNDRGLEEYAFAKGVWSHHPRSVPPVDGRVTAMALIGKDVLARVSNDDGGVSLLEFRLDSLAAPRVQAGPQWWERATCVDY